MVRSETNFLAEYAGVADDVEVLPGLTVGAGRALLQRPAEDPPGAVFMPAVSYSAEAGETGQMAVYARRNPGERVPMVLFVHGGGWSSGHHYGEIRYIYPLAAQGYVAASATYRLAEEAPWPAAIEDTKCAVRWLRHHAGELGGDPDHIVICGGSAGGQLAALAALTPGYYEGGGGWDGVSSEVQGAFLLSPAVDLRAIAERSDVVGAAIAEYFRDDISAASPSNHITSSCPPILTLTGGADVVTTPAEVLRFHDALERAGVAQRLEVFEGRIHGFDLFPAEFKLCLSMLVDFLASTVGVPMGVSRD